MNHVPEVANETQPLLSTALDRNTSAVTIRADLVMLTYPQ